MDSETTNTARFQDDLRRLLPGRATQIAWVVLALVFLWFHLGSIRHLLGMWTSEEDYQHCFVVPLFSLYLLWVRRDMIQPLGSHGSLWGLPFFAVWAVMQWAAAYYRYGTLPEVSILPFFVGLALITGGWQGLRWAWPAIFFLGFMIPLPGAVQASARDFLQLVATRCSTYVIATLGIPSVAEGNIIRLNGGRTLEVARACSGLRMMMLFFAICVGAALLMRKPLWERLLIAASAVPIAVVSNVIRIVLTAIFYEIAMRWPSLIDLDAHAEMIHDWAGYAMMPIGLLLLLVETTLLAKLLVEPVESPLVIGGAGRPGNAAVGVSERRLRRRR